MHWLPRLGSDLRFHITIRRSDHISNETTNQAAHANAKASQEMTGIVSQSWHQMPKGQCFLMRLQLIRGQPHHFHDNEPRKPAFSFLSRWYFSTSIPANTVIRPP